MALIPHKVVRLGAIALIGVLSIIDWHMGLVFILAFLALMLGAKPNWDKVYEERRRKNNNPYYQY